jgi:hypothetical protein
MPESVQCLLQELDHNNVKSSKPSTDQIDYYKSKMRFIQNFN